MHGTDLDLHLDQGLGLHLEGVDLGLVDQGLQGVNLGLQEVDLGLEAVDLGGLHLEGVDLGLEGVDQEGHPLLHLYQLLLNLLDLSSLDAQSFNNYRA